MGRKLAIEMSDEVEAQVDYIIANVKVDKDMDVMSRAIGFYFYAIEEMKAGKEVCLREGEKVIVLPPEMFDLRK